MTFTKESGYSAYPTYCVDLPDGGRATIAVTDANHLHFDANSNSLGRGPRRQFIVCRGVEYGASIHFNRVNGEWAADQKYTHVIRVDFSRKEPSASARQWITATALEIVKAFDSAYAEVFDMAERQSLQTNIDRKRAELAEARKQAAELQTAIEKLEAELAAVTA